MGISREQAVECFRSDDLIGIGMEADAVRRRLHPEGVVTYSIASTIHCHNSSAVAEQVVRVLESDATTIHIRNLANTVQTLSAIEAALGDIRHRHPEIWIQALSAPEILALADSSNCTSGEILRRLRDAGLSSISGDGVNLLSKSRSGDTRCTVSEWLEVHGTAHKVGIRTEAVMLFGGGESFEQRISFLEAVRELQQQTGGFCSFIPTAAPPPNGRDLDGVTAVERLKTLAVSRMFLDNIENIQASWAGNGLKVLQVELRFGTNDLGAVSPTHAQPDADRSEENLRRIIRDAGFRPAQRNSDFTAMLLN